MNSNLVAYLPYPYSIDAPNRIVSLSMTQDVGHPLVRSCPRGWRRPPLLSVPYCLILKHFGWMIPAQWQQLKLEASQHLHRTVDTADAGSPPSGAAH